MTLKTTYPFIISFLLLATVLLINRSNFNSMKEYTQQVDHSRDVINRFERLSNHYKSFQIYSRSFARIAPRRYYILYQNEAKEVKTDLAYLNQLVAEDTVQVQRVRLVAGLIEQHWDTLMNYSIAEVVNMGGGWRLNDLFAVHKAINEAIAYENNILSTQKEELNRSTEVTSTVSILFTGLALGILLVAFASNLALTQQRQRLEGLLASILDTSQNAIINFRAVRNRNQIQDFTIEFANPAVDSLLQIKPADLIGHRLSSVSSLATEKNLISRFAQVVTTRQPEQFEWPYSKGEATIWLHAVLAPLNDGLTVTLHDITPVKQSQEALQVKIRQLNQSNENLRQFAYIASHDLQEPLRKIQSFGDIIQDQFAPDLSPPAADLLQRMQAASRRMSTLIQALLSYSRLSAEPAFLPVSLRTVVDEVLSDLDLLVQEKNVSIQVDPLPTLTGDALQLHQLFQNLLSNALKFLRTDVPGEVSVTCQPVNGTDLPAELSANSNQPFYAIAVRDNGIGFDEKYLDRIFQLFQRLHTKSSFTGTGIGLAICKKVVENHHGYITARSRPGQGTTFTVYLPVS